MSVSTRFAFSIPSSRHPEHNEDAWFLDNGKRIAAVFDGMGGHAGGQVAATLAQETLAYWSDHQAIVPGWSFRVALNIRERLQTEKQKNAAFREMGTTGVVALHTPELFEISWSGDSRAYAWDGSVLQPLTRDHDLLHWILQSEQIDSEERDRLSQLLDETDDLHALEARGEKIAVAAFLRRNQLWSELGTPEGEISSATFSPTPEISVLLTSDGIHDNLQTSEIAALLAAHPQAEVCEKIVQAAYARGASEHLRAKPDDMTCVILPSYRSEVTE